MRFFDNNNYDEADLDFLSGLLSRDLSMIADDTVVVNIFFDNSVISADIYSSSDVSVDFVTKYLLELFVGADKENIRVCVNGANGAPRSA